MYFVNGLNKQHCGFFTSNTWQLFIPDSVLGLFSSDFYLPGVLEEIKNVQISPN